MTCARRRAGAQRAAASDPSRPPSPRPSPPRDRARPDAPGTPARLFLLLPVLALLLGLFTTVPAQAQTTVWSATLTVDVASVYGGCANSGSFGSFTQYAALDDCSSASVLTDDDFEYGGTTYTISRISEYNVGTSLQIGFTGVTGANAKTALSALTLKVGTGATAKTFAIADATASTIAGDVLNWSTAAVSWAEDSTVALSLTAASTNSAATGKPSISGTATVGQTLTAAKGTIADTNGVTKADASASGFAYTYQWIRVDSDGTSNAANISGATSSTYTLASADQGKKIKVKVGFKDDAGNAESRTSDAYPASGTVAAADTTGPAVTAIAVTSTAPRTGSWYGQVITGLLWDEIQVTVTFDDVIVVTGSPELKIRVGAGSGSEKTATCARKGSTGDDRKKLVCTYTVASGDEDTNGISVERNKLSRPSGVTIKDGSNNDATLTYGTSIALGNQSSHKVDGKAPTLSFEGPTPTGPAQSKSVTVTASDSGAGIGNTGFYWFVSAATACDEASASAAGGAKADYTSGTAFTISSESRNGQYLCSNLVDFANNVGYAKSAEITGIDTTDPGIAFPASWTPKTGVSGTLTLTDANAKIKKYGAITVDGTTGAATDCDTASEVGSGNLTTLDTLLASVSYAYKPPADSAGKKVCVYAEDAAGNSLARLWGTAIAQGVPAKPTGLTATPGNTQVTLSWTNPNDPTITKYRLAHKKKSAAGNAAFSDITGSSASTISHTVTGLDNNAVYQFWLLAVNSAGEGTHAGPAEATPAAVDNTGPSVSAIAITSSPRTNTESQYAIGDDIEVTVTFDEAIVLTGSPALKIRIGTGTGSEKSASCATKGTTGDDAKKLECSYTVAEGDLDTDGIAVETGKLAGTIKDAASNAATLTYTAIAAQSGHKVDGVRPTVTELSAVEALRPAGVPMRVMVLFSEDVQVTGAPTLAVKVGVQTRTATFSTAGQSGVRKPFYYTVQAGEEDGDGVTVDAGSVTLPAGASIKDYAGNDATLTHAGMSSSSLRVDGVKPAIAFPTAGPRVGSASRIRLTDATAKVTKYGANVVAGTAIDVSGCDTASEITALTELTPPISPANLDFTPPEGSVGKKVCVFVEDAAGNSHAELWGTAIAAAAAAVGPSASDEQIVPADWALIPKDSSNDPLFTDGQRFRLLFVTSTKTAATSTAISTYNGFVQKAANQNPPLWPFKSQFRALISTSDVDARDNTATTGTGVPIYWVAGEKVADDYADFYDGSWDSRARRSETGGRNVGKSVWTGSNDDGTKHSRPAGHGSSVRYGSPRSGSPLSAGSNMEPGSSHPLYALSPVLRVDGGRSGITVHGVKLSALSVTPHDDRVDLFWRVLDRSQRRGSIRYVVWWREAGATGWNIYELWSYYTLMRTTIAPREWWVRTGNYAGPHRDRDPKPLKAGTSYDVRVYVGATHRPTLDGLAYETTVTTTGTATAMAPPPPPPALEWARVNGAELALRFDTDLDESSAPAAGAFAVSVAGSARGVSSVSVRQDLVTLTLAEAVAAGETVTVGYAPPDSGALRASGGAAVAAFSGAAVTNDTPSGQPQVQPPLTASVSQAPSEHRGNGEFALRVAFSAPVAGRAKDAGVEVSGGTLTRAVRVKKRKDLWELRIAPTGYGAVTVTLPATADCAASGAVCTADGRRLETALTHTVPGPVALSVADARAKEGEDATIDFAVTLSRAASAEVTVRYATRNGTAKKGKDYTKAKGMLVFAAGETAKTVSVAILDDAKDEDEETFRLLLTRAEGAVIADGEAVGTIENDDPMPAAWLARFGRTVAGQAVDAVTARLEGGGPSQVTLGGQTVNLDTPEGQAQAAADIDAVARALGAGPEDRWPRDPWTRGGERDDGAGSTSRTMTGRELLLGSAFHLQSGGEAGDRSFAAWGRVATGGFDGEEGGVTMDGTVTTGFLGADVSSGRWLAGMALARSEGEGTFGLSGAAAGESAFDNGTIESTLTSLLPYARLEVNERVTAWGLAGYGTGELTLTEKGETETDRHTADLAMTLGALGGRGTLVDAPEGGGFALALKGDALWVRTESDATQGMAAAKADVTRLRLILDASRPFAAGGGTLTPSLDVGLRLDGGDAETGAGVELGAGLGWADPESGVSAELRGRWLAAHESSGYEEWGASGSIRIDPGASGRGLSLTLAPTVGNASSGTGTLWSAADARGIEPGGTFEAERSLDAEVGYGLALFGGRFTGTPHAGMALSQGAREYRLGWRLTSAIRGDPGFEIGLDATRKESANDNAPPEHGIGLRMTARW